MLTIRKKRMEADATVPEATVPDATVPDATVLAPPGPEAEPLGHEPEAATEPGGTSAKRYTVFAIFGIVATVCLIVVLVLQFLEFSFYSANPSVWPAK